jgi:hypothetical protein
MRSPAKAGVDADCARWSGTPATTQIFDLMNELELFGIRLAYNE